MVQLSFEEFNAYVTPYGVIAYVLVVKKQDVQPTTLLPLQIVCFSMANKRI